MSETFVLNGKETPYQPGQTILEAAKNGGVVIPSLCYLKGSTPTGACRICCVEVKGARSLMAPRAITTIREHIAWSYANLAMADAALSASANAYATVHFMIRNKLYHGLISGRMSMRTLA